MDYVEGQEVMLGESVYLVERIYNLSDEYMKQYDLYHRTRVTLTIVSGDGLERMDFALPAAQ